MHRVPQNRKYIGNTPETENPQGTEKTIRRTGRINGIESHGVLGAGQSARGRNAPIQVMPIDCRSHAGLDGPPALLETPDTELLAYSEGQGNVRLIANLGAAAVPHRRHATLRSQALSPLGTVGGLLKRIGGEP
ncbi:Scr1 family TA system antitoxin-like transcriptional regulator [Streptomyces sp. NPDC003077]|uniref:Scr1 family TA system antitoxin-like transcriptional regulator n=1 Tax=Streptomyces sp. NPDC003077 TaxID=3154443 RepID=UPI0033BB4F5E